VLFKKYFAPEMAAYEGVGRSADIFSLGCILLEMHAAMQLQPGIKTLRSLRSKHDKSFQANLNSISEWLSKPMWLEGVLDYQIRDQVRRMLGKDPTGRPTIAEVRDSFAVVDAFQEHCGRTRLFMGCCGNSYVSKETHEQGLKMAYSNGQEEARAKMQKTIDELRREKNDLQQRVIELQETVEQQTQSLDAWAQQDGVRLNKETQMNDSRAETRSAELPIGSAAHRYPPPPEGFPRRLALSLDHCRVCGMLWETSDELKKHSSEKHGLTPAQAILPPDQSYLQKKFPWETPLYQQKSGTYH
jgi:serine/threonine protein kinase